MLAGRRFDRTFGKRVQRFANGTRPRDGGNRVKVRAIQTGTVAVRTRQQRGAGRGPVRLARTLGDRNWTPPLPIYAWLIEHAEGLIVVDIGETARVMTRDTFRAGTPTSSSVHELAPAPGALYAKLVETLGVRLQRIA